MSDLDGIRDLMPDGLPRPNIPLLKKVLDHIDAHPEEWNQAGWAHRNSCGTVACIAGHAVAMTEGLVDRGGVLCPTSGDDFYDAGERALGITKDESFHLFWPTNTREIVQRHAEAIAARAGERL